MSQKKCEFFNSYAYEGKSIARRLGRSSNLGALTAIIRNRGTKKVWWGFHVHTGRVIMSPAQDKREKGTS